jgi:hypothetical protein
MKDVLGNDHGGCALAKLPGLLPSFDDFGQMRKSFLSESYENQDSCRLLWVPGSPIPGREEKGRSPPLRHNILDFVPFLG